MINASAKILLVDDDDSLRRVLEFQLVEAGYAVVSQSDGREALKSKYSSRYSLSTSSTTSTAIRFGLNRPMRASCSPLKPSASYLSRTRLKCRQLIPNISAASIQLIFFAYALNIISSLFIARSHEAPEYDLVATYGTANRLREVGLECESVFKVNEGRPNIADLIMQGEIALIINTPLGKTSFYDEQAIRKAALQFNTPCVTTITGAEALVEAIGTKMSEQHVTVRSLQEIHFEAEIRTAESLCRESN